MSPKVVKGVRGGNLHFFYFIILSIGQPTHYPFFIMPDDHEITQFHAIQYWFVCIYGVRLLTAGFNSWEQEVNIFLDANIALCVKGNYIKKLKNWQHAIAGPFTHKIIRQQQMRFVLNIIKQVTLQYPTQYAPSLHIALLCEASSLLLASLKGEMNINTRKEIAEWFSLMKEELVHSFVKKFDANKHDELKKLVAQYKDDDNILNNGDHPNTYFNAKALFIYIANVVYFECYKPEYELYIGQEIPECNETNLKGDTDEWRKHCGKMMIALFYPNKPSDGGGPLSNYRSKTLHRGFDLPIIPEKLVSDFATNVRLLKAEKPPPVHEIFIFLLNKYENVLRKIMQDYIADGSEKSHVKEQLEIFMQYKNLCEPQVKECLKNLDAREKEARCRTNKHKEDRKVVPKIEFGSLDADSFCLSDLSHEDCWQKFVQAITEEVPMCFVTASI